MAMVINTNIMSINAQNNLRTSQTDMNTAMERLSSGKRVNSAADDAAGLAIINRFTSQERGLNIAIRNANDGISMIQTAEGALDETTNILQRMRELAIQSANGIYSDANRATLNAEVTQLKAELTRIAETTSFNGLKILDGTLGDIELQVGAEAGERIIVNTGSGFDAESLGAEDSTVASGTYTLSESTNAAVSGDPGTLNALVAGDLVLNGVAIPGAEAYDTVSSSDNGASALGIAGAINSVNDQTGITATATNTVDLGSFDSDATISLGAFVVTAGAGDGDTTIALGAGGIVINGQDVIGNIGVNGTTADLVGAELVGLINGTANIGVTASLDGSNNVILKSTDGSEISVSTSGNLSDTVAVVDEVNSTGGDFDFTDNTPNSDVFTPVAATLAGNDLVINGTQIEGSISNQTDLLNAINGESGNTGVTASVDADSGNVILTAIDGRNIQVATQDSGVVTTDNDGLTDFMSLSNLDLAAASDTVFAGQVSMTGSSIELTGADTSGFSTVESVAALQTTAGAAPTMTLDVTDTASVTDDATVTFTLNGQTISFKTDNDTSGNDDEDTAANLIQAINDASTLTGITAEAGTDAANVILTGVVGSGPIELITDISGTAANTNVDIDIIAIDGTDVTGAGANYADIFENADENTAGTWLAVGTGTDATFTAPTNNDLTINGYIVDFDGASLDVETSTVAGSSSAAFIAEAINTTTGLKDEVTASALTVMNLGEVRAGDADEAFTLIVNGLVVDIDNAVLAGDTDGNITGTLNTAFADAANIAENAVAGQAFTDGNNYTQTQIDTYAQSGGLVASVNTSGELIITANDGRNITMSVGDTANTASLLTGFDVTAAGSVTSKGTVALTANEGFKIGDIGGANPGLAGIENGGDSIADIDISTQTGAQDAIAVVDRALDYIADARGDLGAASNRLSFTINNLSSVVENAAAARSRVQDADFAVESAALARAQVLQQAGTAMLAQANAAPQSVLSLLQ